MKLNFKVTPKSIEEVLKGIEDKLQVAAIRGWEKAVELTPAAGETPYSTGFLRQGLRVQKTGSLEYTLFSPASHSVFLEFGTGPRGQATGGMPEFPDDIQPSLSYHRGKVYVTRHGGRLLNTPYVRNTQGMAAQPFIRPALLEMVNQLEDLLK